MGNSVSFKSQNCNLAVRQLQLKLNAVRYNIHGLWPYLDPDGIMGTQTKKAIAGFKAYKHIPSTDNDWLLKLDQEYQNVPMLRDASSSMICKIPSSENKITSTNSFAQQPTSQELIHSNTSKGISTSINSIYKTEYLVSTNEKGLAFILKKWEEVLVQQYEGLLRRLDKFPTKKTMRIRNVTQQMEQCRKFLERASRYGIVSATKEFGSKLTKEEAIRSIQELGKIIKDSSLTKGISAVNKMLSKIKSIIDPVLKVLNKIPGLKYYSVMEKIVKATSAMIQGNYENAFALYMDGLRELVEQILIDAAVVALVAAGGWIALVVAIVLIIGTFLIDYLLFSDTPGNSLSDMYLGIKTRNLMMENAPITYKIITNGYIP